MKRITVFVASILFAFNPIFSQNGLDFDGTDDRIDCGTDTSVMISGKTITLEAWIYPTAWKTNIFDGNIICKEDNKSNYGYMMRCGAGGKLNFAYGDGSWHELNSAGTVLTLNTWQHVAGSYDGTKLRLYVNGVAVDSASGTGGITASNAANLEIGCHLTYTRYFQGMIDEVRIWNSARSASLIKANYNKELCSRDKTLRAYYKFNQGKAGLTNFSVKSLTDLSGYNNTGTLTGFTLSGSSSNWLKGATLIRDVFNGTVTTSRCDYMFSPSNKFKWTATGVYYDTIQTFMGCDSAIKVNLTIKKSTSKTIKAYACTSYTSPSGIYTWTTSGTYTDYLRNSINCDSIITVILKIGGGRDSIEPAVCKSYTTPSGKYTFTQSGSYNDTLVDFRGCDSIILINLTILKATYAKIYPNVCHTYTTPSGKHTYTQTGVYMDTMVNYYGCDSFISIELKIRKTSNTINRTACYNYTSPSGKHIWTISGVYQDTIPNAFGCDSALTINLTINSATFSNIQTTECRSYVSPGKKKIWTKTGIYKDTLTNYKGCDSIITVDLTINTVNTGVTASGSTLTASSSATGYQWLNCELLHAKINGETNKTFTAVKTGYYAVEVTENACKDTSTCYKITISGVQNPEKIIPFHIVPNPGDGKYEIELNNSAGDISIDVHNITGKMILHKESSSTDTIAFDLQAPSGVYWVTLRQGDNVSCQKLVHR